MSILTGHATAFRRPFALVIGLFIAATALVACSDGATPSELPEEGAALTLDDFLEQSQILCTQGMAESEIRDAMGPFATEQLIAIGVDDSWVAECAGWEAGSSRIYPSVWDLPEIPGADASTVTELRIRYDGVIMEAIFDVPDLPEAEAVEWLQSIPADMVDVVKSDSHLFFTSLSGEPMVASYQLPRDDEDATTMFRVYNGRNDTFSATGDPNVAIELPDEWKALPIPDHWTFKNASVRYIGTSKGGMTWNSPQFRLNFTDNFPDPVGEFNVWIDSLLQEGWSRADGNAALVVGPQFTIYAGKGTGYSENGQHALWIYANEGANPKDLPSFAPTD